MPIAESFYTSFTSHLSLLLTYFMYTQIIKSQIGRNSGLVVPLKKGLCFRYISPFCETFSPPLIIFWYRVKLRKIECYDACFVFVV